MDRVKALRHNASLEDNPETDYQNVACIRTNAMKHLPNFFKKGQLSTMFFLFPGLFQMLIFVDRDQRTLSRIDGLGSPVFSCETNRKIHISKLKNTNGELFLIHYYQNMHIYCVSEEEFIQILMCMIYTCKFLEVFIKLRWPDSFKMDGRLPFASSLIWKNPGWRFEGRYLF